MFSWANKQLEKLSETLAPPPSTPGHRFLAALASGDEPAALAALNDTSESFDPNNAYGPFDPNAPLNHRGMNALHAAASHGNAQVMRAVLARGVHVESRDNDGWTALHHAAGTSSVPPQSALATAKMLVGEMGADLCAKTKGGQTPYDVGASQAVRGYLLPLQLQRETQQCLDNGGAGLAPGIDLGGHVKNVAPPPTMMPGQMPPAPGAPPQMGNDPIAGLMQPPNAAPAADPYAALMQPPPVRGVGSAYSSHSSLASGHGSAPPSGPSSFGTPAKPPDANNAPSTFGQPSPVGNENATFSSPPVAASPALMQPPAMGDASATFASPPVATSTPADAPAGKPSAASSFLPPPPKMTSLSPPPVMTSLVNDMKDASLNDGAEQPAVGDATAEAAGEEEDEGMKEVNLDESAEEPQPVPEPALTQIQPPQQHAPTLGNAGTGFGQPPVQIQPPQPQPQMQQTPEQPPKSNNSVSSHPGQPPKSANSAASSSSGYALRGGNSNAAFVLDQSKFSGRRIYKPDGFHTSSNDKELQAKYGHVDNEFETSRKLAVPPPPMSGGAPVNGGAPGGANPYSAAGAGGPPSGGGNPYSAMGGGASRGRYPAYCAVSDSVSAPPSFAGQGSQPGAAQVPAYATFNPAAAQTQQQQWSGDQQQQQLQQPQQMQQQYSAQHGSTFS
ncbi:hypothetical protein ACHAXT_002787 [Thalassiosira profunda]